MTYVAFVSQLDFDGERVVGSDVKLHNYKRMLGSERLGNLRVFLAASFRHVSCTLGRQLKSLPVDNEHCLARYRIELFD